MQSAVIIQSENTSPLTRLAWVHIVIRNWSEYVANNILKESVSFVCKISFSVAFFYLCRTHQAFDLWLGLIKDRQ